jgi:DNA mismatch endonuclease (patch repair protein)
MRGNRKRDTQPETALRLALYRQGLRYRKDYPIRPDSGRPIRADIVFPRRRVAVFVDGCFWHGCPRHGTQPRSNTRYWTLKLARNVERDREVDTRLRDGGWTVVRVWEHEAVPDAVVRVRTALGLGILRAEPADAGRRPTTTR